MSGAIRDLRVRDDVDLRPLLSRDRYTDEEWEYATAGRCSWPNPPHQQVQRCGDPSDPQSFHRYCNLHDGLVRTYADGPA